MSLSLKVAPDEYPVTLAEAKAHMRVETDVEDALIEGMIKAATSYLDGDHGILRRALISQTWEYCVSGFVKEIELPLPLLREVVSIKYIDLDGEEQTVDPSVYHYLKGEFGKVYLAFGEYWPSTRHEPEAVKIQYKAGFGSASDVPQPIKQAILAHVGEMYNNREATGRDQGILPLGYEDLIDPYRVRSL